MKRKKSTEVLKSQISQNATANSTVLLFFTQKSVHREIMIKQQTIDIYRDAMLFHVLYCR